MALGPSRRREYYYSRVKPTNSSGVQGPNPSSRSLLLSEPHAVDRLLPVSLLGTIATALFGLSPQALDHALAQIPRPSHGDRWGCWTLDAKHLTLDFLPQDNRPGSGWFVDLKKLTSAQSVYETIFRVQAKRYIGAEDLGNFVESLHDLGLTISSRPTPFDPVAHLTSLISRRFREN